MSIRFICGPGCCFPENAFEEDSSRAYSFQLDFRADCCLIMGALEDKACSVYLSGTGFATDGPRTLEGKLPKECLPDQGEPFVLDVVGGMLSVQMLTGVLLNRGDGEVG